MVDAFHETAFRGSKLANPLFCSHEVATNMKREDILLFRRKQVIAPRMMVGVVGPIDHGEVVKMVEKYFATLPSAPPTEQEMRVIKPSLKQKSTFSKLWTPSTPTVVSSSTSASTSSSTTTTLSQPVKPLTVQDIISSTPTTYTGGFHFMDYPVDNQTARTYIQILLGFKGVSCIDKELPILAILNVLMGGGNSFSVGGPGKGILSRLFTDVLNVYPFVENAICMSGNNYDTGFFGLHIMVPPKHAVDGLEIIVHELLRIPEDITEVQLNRARNQLKSMVLSSLETRPMALDDFMRQIMLSNEHIPVEQVCEKLDAITTADIKNFGAKLIKSKPTLVVMGPHQQYLPREPTEAFISRIFTSHSKTN